MRETAEKEERFLRIAPRHGELCGCRQCAPPPQEQGEGFRIRSRRTKGALVVTAEKSAAGEREASGNRLAELLEDLGAKLEERGAVIGHIKASLEYRSAETFSLTRKKAERKNAGDGEFRLVLNAILFIAEEEFAVNLVRDMLRQL